jgi:hypothetical protein
MRDTAARHLLGSFSPRVQQKLLAARTAQNEGGYLLLVRRSLGWLKRRIT